VINSVKDIYTCVLSTSSLATVVRLEKGLSNTMHAMEGSIAPYNKLVAAPILLPHKPIVDTVPVCLKWFTSA
jgi:hypothetical protein